jgi:hypothetical protein
MKLIRREFLIRGLALPTVAVFMGRFLAACAKDSTAVTCSTGFTATSGAANTGDSHTHTITVTQADITAGAQKVYTTSTAGSIPHSHNVTLIAGDFTKLAANQGISETTTSDSSGHTHTFGITCS